MARKDSKETEKEAKPATTSRCWQGQKIKAFLFGTLLPIMHLLKKIICCRHLFHCPDQI